MTTRHYGYSKDFTREREAEQAEREKELERARKENERIRNERLARLDREREQQRKQVQREQEAALAPAKERARRQWLYDHPERTADDFERHAWPLLKANLLEDEREQRLEQEKAALRRRYGL